MDDGSRPVWIGTRLASPSHLAETACRLAGAIAKATGKGRDKCCFAIPFLPGDVDEDGTMDIVFSTHSGEVQFLHGTGGGSFRAAAVLRSGTAAGPSALGLADMDGDVDNDITLSLGTIFLENTAPHLGSSASVAVFSGTSLTSAVDLTTGDVNNEGRLDLIAVDGGFNPASFRKTFFRLQAGELP